MKKKTIIIALSIILLLLLMSLVLIIFYSDIKSFFIKNRKIEEYNFLNIDQIKKKDQSDDINKIIEKEIKIFPREKEIKLSRIEKYALNEESPKSLSKETSLEDFDFNALGEYVSEEEKDYRYKVVKNLKIKTIIIDYLASGNGITQEFYRIAYKEKMIPAKILDQIIESKEFRSLIPKKYLKNEKNIKLKKNEKIIFSNYKITNLLFLWCEGKLTPIKKAWQTQALSSK